MGRKWILVGVESIFEIHDACKYPISIPCMTETYMKQTIHGREANAGLICCQASLRPVDEPYSLGWSRHS